ncbi:MAG: uridine kinase [Planctomycetes bacterium]|jgi:uridine kinase|nr:uridine kinase [Planctomycetota bacterium]
MTEDRSRIIDQLADAITAQPCRHTLRVGIDGRSASGKTVLADELVEPIERRGRPVIRASIDGFHHPRQVRYAAGHSPAAYYRDSFDTGAIRRCVLDPLGPHGDGAYRPAAFDFRTDAAVHAPIEQAAADAVLLFEGVFLMRPELDDAWDYRILVEASVDVTLTRAVERDRTLFGDAEAVRRRYVDRYVPGQQRYRDQVRPQDRADAIVLNDDVDRPQLLWSAQRAGVGTIT